LKHAFEQLELLVVIDLFRNETAEIGDYVLPATSPLERPDLLFSFPLLLGMQHRPYLQATKRVLDPLPDQWEETRIFTELAHAAGAPIFGSWAAHGLLLAGTRLAYGPHQARSLGLTSERMLSLFLRLTRQGSFSALADQPHGLLRPPHEPESFLGRRVLTRDGRVHLAPPPLLEAARRLDEAFRAEEESSSSLRLITKRSVRTHNSWTHNVERFLRHEGGTNHLYLHPDDAARLGLGDGGWADVESRTGKVRVPVKLSKDLRPGTVALPHGWGHQDAKGLTVASASTGVNSNLLADDGPEALERLSGMAQLTAFPVEVRRAPSPPDPKSWSGIS
jgi:anaerobic selenocysteine-containing dehydrogenase